MGLDICRRLIDEFIRTKPLTTELTIIFTTRNKEKEEETLELLDRHLKSFGTSFVAARFTKRVHLRGENVELTDLLSVRALYRKLLQSNVPKLDAVILNAGFGGWSGLNWPLAFWQVGTDLIQGVTWPSYKIATYGRLTKPQLPTMGGERKVPEPALGEVFCANVFGHYMLTHGLMPLLRSCPPKSPGRIIWLSTIEVSGRDFNSDDLQGLNAPSAYGRAKRLTDLLSLTSADQSATAKSVETFLDAKPKSVAGGGNGSSSKPSIHVAHPGICSTSIIPLHFILQLAMLVTFYLARWLGSPWHTISAFSGANAPVWLAFASEDDIKAKETRSDGTRGRVKWGSATTRGGTEMVVKTDVQGWGVDGSGGTVEWWLRGGRGRMRGATDATKEDIETFVEEGAKVWREMEQLRVEWSQRLDEYEKVQGQNQS